MKQSFIDECKKEAHRLYLNKLPAMESKFAAAIPKAMESIQGVLKEQQEQVEAFLSQLRKGKPI